MRKFITSNLKTGISFVLGTCITIMGQAAMAESYALEEVVVTATKRAENVQDVPISVGVVTGEFMKAFDIKDMSDVQNFVPGLQVQQTFGSWAVRVRGLGSGISNLAFDASVPIYIDDVYCGRGKCMESSFLDVTRLEVARGPQGALFGKSTIAGAITAVTGKPTEEFEGEFKVGYEGQDGGFSSSAYVSGALSDNFRARLAVRTDNLDGYTDNTFTGNDDGAKESTVGRLSFEFDVTDATMLSLKLEGGKSTTDGRNNQLINPGAMSSVTLDADAEYAADDIRRVSTGDAREDYYDYEWSLATFTIDTEVADHTVKAIASYWEYENEWFLDVDGHPEAILNTRLFDDYDQTSFEVRVLSPANETFEYIAGIWYQNSNLKTRQYSPFYPNFWNAVTGIPIAVGVNIPPLALAFTNGSGMDRNFLRESDAFSAYAQLTWNMNDRLRAIFDIRYTDEEQEAVGASWPLSFPNGAFDPQRVLQSTAGHDPEYLFRQTREDDSVDPSLRVQYDVNDDMMIYGVYARGSKAGGMKANDSKLGAQLLQRAGDAAYLQEFVGASSIDAAAVLGGLTLKQGNGVFDFENEEATSWEAGLKTSLADGAANLNLAVFTTEFENLQTSSYDGTQFIIGNAGVATVNGFEIELAWQATENLRLNGSLAWIDAVYDDYAGAQCVIDGTGATINSDCDAVSGTENQSGERLERSPDMEMNITAMWESEISDSLLIRAMGSIYHSDEYHVRADISPRGTQSSFTKYDARISLLSSDEKWEIALNGRNLSDEMTIQHAYEIAGSAFQNLSIGRTVTLEGIVRF